MSTVVPRRTRCIVTALITTAALAMVPVASGWAEQTWPNRPITLVVPFPAGGFGDVLGRFVAKHLQDELAQPVVVENKPGASGQIGTEIVARAKPDGYTLMVTGPHHVINPALKPALPYDASRDFTPIAALTEMTLALVVNGKSPINNLDDYLKAARIQKGGMSYGSSSIGGSSHMAGELLKLTTGAPLVHVPYNGTAPGLTDLMGGQIPSLIMDVGMAALYAKDGKLKPIAVTSRQRSEALPDVPTVAEQGFPDYEVTAFMGFYGPAGLPPALTKRLNTIALDAMTSGSTSEWLKQNGVQAGKLNPAQFRVFVDEELLKWKDVVAKAGIKAE